MSQSHHRVIELDDGRLIGEGHPCFVIAEAGSNWRMGTPSRDRAMARALIDVAVEAGCDAVKFQTYKSDTVYVENAGQSEYLAEAGITTSIREIFDDLSMPYELLGELSAYCRLQGIRFMSTPFSVQDAEAVDPYVNFHKIASYEISHTELQAWLAARGKPIVFSTGASNWEEIDFALSHLRAHGAEQLAIMQCTAKYPAPLESLNLRVLPEFKARYKVPVGLSDHSRDPRIAPSAAVALGAHIIEKHYTLHNRLPGADHPFALEPDELKAMVQSIRHTELVLGQREKQVVEVERELGAFARRGLQALKRLEPGDRLKLGVNVGILRPGERALGAHPRYLPEMGGAVRRVIEPGDGVMREDVEP